MKNDRCIIGNVRSGVGETAEKAKVTVCQYCPVIVHGICVSLIGQLFATRH